MFSGLAAAVVLGAVFGAVKLRTPAPSTNAVGAPSGGYNQMFWPAVGSLGRGSAPAELSPLGPSTKTLNDQSTAATGAGSGSARPRPVGAELGSIQPGVLTGANGGAVPQSDLDGWAVLRAVSPAGEREGSRRTMFRSRDGAPLRPGGGGRHRLRLHPPGAVRWPDHFRRSPVGLGSPPTRQRPRGMGVDAAGSGGQLRFNGPDGTIGFTPGLGKPRPSCGATP